MDTTEYTVLAYPELADESDFEEADISTESAPVFDMPGMWEFPDAEWTKEEEIIPEAVSNGAENPKEAGKRSLLQEEEGAGD